MNKLGFFATSILVLVIFHSFSPFPNINAAPQPCEPSGRIKGRKPPPDLQDYQCCVQGKIYRTYKCSPHVSNATKALLTLNSFEKGGALYGPSKCDGRYHSDDTPVVALSSGWFNGGERCLNGVIISAKNGRSVKAMVVDLCDSSVGCDEEHYYRPPCGNNVVDASIAVWKALDVPESDWGEMDITWSDHKKWTDARVTKNDTKFCLQTQLANNDWM